MSAINPSSPWRGAMVDASETGFDAGDRAAAAFLYSGLLETEAVAAVILPSGSSDPKRKRRTLVLRRRLSAEKIRELTDRVHHKRRAIWERPKEKQPKTARRVKPKIKTPDVAVTYIDRTIHDEADALGAVVDLAKVRASIEAERQARTAEENRQREARRIQIADLVAQRNAKVYARQREDDEDAISMLLLVA